MAALLPANAQTVWQDLTAQGASPVQAAAILGNMLHEDSQLDPELVAMDSNGAYSRGLVMWNDLGAGANVNWSQYITGNVQQDLAAQVGLIKAQGGFAKAAGSDPYTAGENFAHLFEACAECGYQGGSAQLPLRGQSAAMVYQVAQSGNWGVGSGQLPPLGQSPVPAGGTPSALESSFLQIPEDLLNPTEIFGGIYGAFSSGKKILSNAEAASKATVALVSALLAPSTWIRTGEVILGTIVGMAGAALFAIVLAGQHPSAVLDVAALIPGEGQVARAATGAATSAARTGRAGATVSGGVRAGRSSSSTARRTPDRAPRAPRATGAGQAARSGSRTATGTARKAAAQSEWTRAARSRERNQRLARQWGPPAASDEDRAADEWAEARERRSRRENRASYRKAMGPRDTSDLRRRSS